MHVVLARPTPPASGGRAATVLAAVVVVAVALAGVAPSPTAAAPGPRPETQAPPPSGFGAPGTPMRPAAERYLRDAYASVLGRPIDEAGLRYWGDRLAYGVSRPTFARQLVLSQESIRDQVRAIYAVFGRKATATELVDATAAIRGGQSSVEATLVRLLALDEFYQQAGSTSAGFVDALYEGVLDRPFDAPGRAFWVDRLDRGARRASVANGFVRSLEHRRVAVEDTYDRVLGRPADGAGRDHWVGRLRAGMSILDVDRGVLASSEAWSMGCSTLDRTRCLLPFPNDEMTIEDPTTDTGRRVLLKSPWVPAPVGGPAFDPAEWNRQDGFSPGSALLVHYGGIDPEQSGLPPLTDIEASLAPDSPVVIVDTKTGERWPFWTELDANAPDDAERALVIRPARNFLDGHTYAVGLGPMRDSTGAALTASPGFRTYRDGPASTSRRVEERRPLIEAAIDAVAGAGLDRSTLHIAWSFTVASTRNLAERAITMRDETLGGPAGQVAAPFTVTSTVRGDDQTTRVDGTFQVPLYLTGTGQPGSRLRRGPDHLPEVGGTFTAPFTCLVPDSAEATPARPALYGHGLLGAGEQAASSATRDLAREHNMVFCGTDWIGLSESDLGNTVAIVANLSKFPELVDRTQQSFLNFMVLGRLMTQQDGLLSHPAFQSGRGLPVIDPGFPLQYYGLSQGGIMGGALVALSTDITRGVLGVPAMNYSTLLERSVDFDPFFDLLAPKYPSALDRITMISMVQMLWDRGETNGYANHITDDPLPGTPTHEVLMQVAFGDHQVAPIAADVEARTIGAATNDPPLAPGRLADVTPLWGIDRIESYPHDGSAIIYWDSGTSAPPIENLPNRAGEDPHSDPRKDPDARRQISAFLQPDGQVIDVCGGSWCVADER